MRSKATGWAILILAVADLGPILLGVRGHPEMGGEPGAWWYEAEPACLLAIYALSGGMLLRSRSAHWEPVCLYAWRFGLLTGAIEMLNLAVEHWMPGIAPPAVTSIGFMLTVFSLWGVAAGAASRACGTVWQGILAAVLSAGICMLLTAGAGFVLELWIAPPSGAEVATWAEYLRSGWDNPRAFAVANTLDSGATHLLLGPVVGAVFGWIGATLMRRRQSPSKPDEKEPR